MPIEVSALNKTWIFDIDGTIALHNGYKLYGRDTLLEGAKEFFEEIPKGDMIILVTSRKEEYRQETIDFLKVNGIRFDHIIFEAPYGERILVNDKKPSGLIMAYAVNTQRDVFLEEEFRVNDEI